MKKIFSILAVAILFISVSSCEKDKGLLPNISFVTTAGYTYQDGTIPVNTPITVGITASKSEDKDVLKKFSYSVNKNGSGETEIESEDLSGDDANSITRTISDITTGSTAGTEKYTFTVVNRDGLVNSISFTLTVTE